MTQPKVSTKTHGYYDSDISWHGYCPWTDGPCFGTEKGELLIPPLGHELDPAGDVSIKIFEGEAVNGAAFSGNLVAISSRVGVSFGYRIYPDRFNVGKIEPTFDSGAHGVIATQSGGFLAPLGHGGLLSMSHVGVRAEWRIGKADGKDLDFYKLISLGAGQVGEVFACATRSSGIIAVEFRGDSEPMPILGHKIAGTDIVDICSLNSLDRPRAVIALDNDMRLLFKSDPLDRKRPALLGFDDLEGPAYSVLSADGHIFVLTSTKLIAFPGLALDFLDGKDLSLERETIVVEIEASEIFLAGEGKIQALTGGEAVEFRIDELVRGSDARSTHGSSISSISDPGLSFTEENFSLSFASAA